MSAPQALAHDRMIVDDEHAAHLLVLAHSRRMRLRGCGCTLYDIHDDLRSAGAFGACLPAAAAHAGAPFAQALDGDFPADHARAIRHDLQSHSGAPRRGSSASPAESNAVVRYREPDVTLLHQELHRDAGRLAMADRIRDRFLRDTIQVIAAASSSVRRGADAAAKAHVDAVHFTRARDEERNANTRPPRSTLTGDRPRASARALSIV